MNRGSTIIRDGTSPLADIRNILWHKELNVKEPACSLFKELRIV